MHINYYPNALATRAKNGRKADTHLYPYTWRAEARASGVQGHLQICCKLEGSLAYGKAQLQADIQTRKRRKREIIEKIEKP